MKKGDIVLHEGSEVQIIRGAPVRFGERRAIVKRLSDGKSYAVTLRHLTKREANLSQAHPLRDWNIPEDDEVWRNAH